MSNLEEHSATLFLVVFMAAVVVIYLAWSQRNLRASRQRIKQYQLPLEEDATPSQNPDALTYAARDLAGQLDNKIDTMGRLVQTAEEQIVRLERAIEKAERLGIADSAKPD